MSRKNTTSIADRVSRFRSKTIDHWLYANTVEDMFVQLVDFDDPPIILLIGPAGAGKSRALKFDLPHKLLGDQPGAPGQLTPFRPYVYTELPSIDQKGFSWLDYYQRGLGKLNEPKVIATRRALPEELSRAMRPLSEGTRGRSTGLARLQLETAMIERGVRWWVIDNAAALVYVASTSSYVSQLNTLMSLANMTESAIIVSATYEILALMDLNGQLDRRIIDIELPRYNGAKDKQDFDQFYNAVLDHLEFSPVALRGDPVSYLPMFYEKSLGLFGCWKVWFDRTFSEAIRSHSNTISKANLEKWAYSKGALNAMLAEIIEGEALYAAFKERQQGFEDSITENIGKNRRKKSIRAPGKRNPHHDPVDETV